jgi:hypothetical protein
LWSRASSARRAHARRREFQLEIDPSLPRWELFKKVMRAQAPPALAPGVMMQLGLVGLVALYRHPTLKGSDT